MSQDYSPSLVTKNLVFCGDAAMKSAAGPATLLYDKVNNNNGTMYNGTCLDFDGTDDSVDVPDNSDLDGFSKFTLSGWVNPNVTGGYRVIFDQYYPSGYTWRISNIDYPYIYVNGNYLTASATVTEGAWNHLVVTYDGTSTSNNVNFYMAGELVSTGTLNEGTVGTSSYGLKIGVDHGGVASPMDGKLADLRIYDVILSAANVKELYDDSKVIIPTKNDASGGFVAQTNLKGWWPLVEGVGTIAYDGSGNGNDGTLTNMTSADWLTGQTGAPQLVEGYNRPMLFDGSSDYVTLSAANVAGASYGTVSAWIYLTGAANDHATIYTCQVGAAWADMRLVLNIKAPNMVRFHLSNGTSYLTNSLVSSALNYNQWYHVAGTYNGTDAKIYIDGSLDATYSTSIVPGTFTSGFTAIGYMSYGSRYFPGIINEVAVYDSACTLAQIQALAATGPNGGPLPPNPASGPSTLPSTANLIGYWRNDGNVTWTDRSSNSNTGTVTGSPDDLLFKQGINGSKNVNTGRDNQGFPLLYKDVGAVGFANYIANTATTGVPIGDTIITSGGANAGSDGSFSVAAWVNAEKLSTTLYVVNKRTQNGNWPCFDIAVGTSGQIICDYSSTTYGQCLETYTTGAGLIEKNKWYYVLFVKPAGSASVNYLDVKIYVNGVSVTWTNSLYGSHLYSNTVATSTEPMYIGRFLDGSSATGNWINPFRGQLGPVHVYQRALTYAEIQQNYKSFKTRFGK